MTPDTNKRMGGWAEWVRTLVNSENPRDVELLIAKIGVEISLAHSEGFKAGIKYVETKDRAYEEGFKEGVEKAVGCVPEEQNMHDPWEHRVEHGDVADCDGCNTKSWNECRGKTLEALRDLLAQDVGGKV